MGFTDICFPHPVQATKKWDESRHSVEEELCQCLNPQSALHSSFKHLV